MVEVRLRAMAESNHSLCLASIFACTSDNGYNAADFTVSLANVFGSLLK